MNHNIQKGFTIIELLVAMGIVVIMSTILVVNFRNVQYIGALDSETEQFVSILRQAQLWSLTGQTQGSERPAGGWGIHLEECSVGSCTYFMFADIYPASVPNYTYDAGNDVKITDINMNSTIEVQTINPNVSGVLDIVFTIPESVMYLNGGQVQEQATILLRHPTSNADRTIRVDRVSGRLNIE